MTKKEVLVGYVAVDSGQVIIVDPCYLGSWRDGESTDKQSHYGECCDVTLSKGAGEVLVSDIAGNGVVSATFDGDGSYPVYAVMDGTRVEKLTIYFK